MIQESNMINKIFVFWSTFKLVVVFVVLVGNMMMIITMYKNINRWTCNFWTKQNQACKSTFQRDFYQSKEL